MKSVIEDIFELRKEKLLRILKAIDPETPVKYLSNAGSVEINLLRPSMQATYGIVDKMQRVKDAAEA